MKKIFRWLLSHLLLILVIVSVIYSYMFWGNLTGEDTPAGKTIAYLSNKFDGVGEFVEGVKNKQARLAGDSSAQTLEQQPLDLQPLDQQQVQVSDAQVPDEQVEKQNIAAIDVAVSNSEIMTAASSQEDKVANNQSEPSNENAIRNQQELAESEANNLNANAISGTVDKMDNGNAEPDMQTAKSTPEQEASPQADSGNLALVIAEQTVAQTAANPSQTELQEDELKVEEGTIDKSADKQAVEQQPVSISYSHNNMQVQQNSDGEVEMHPQAQSLTSSVAGNGAKENSAKANRTNEGVYSEKNSPMGGAEMLGGAEMSIPEIWVIARTSFYQKNYSLSEQSYQSLIAATKDNFDAYGELGNVYFNQGKKAQAAEAYLQAATILLFKGDVQRAQSLLQILQPLDTSKASQLQRLIDSFPS